MGCVDVTMYSPSAVTYAEKRAPARRGATRAVDQHAHKFCFSTVSAVEARLGCPRTERAQGCSISVGASRLRLEQGPLKAERSGAHGQHPQPTPQSQTSCEWACSSLRTASRSLDRQIEATYGRERLGGSGAAAGDGKGSLGCLSRRRRCTWNHQKTTGQGASGLHARNHDELGAPHGHSFSGATVGGAVVFPKPPFFFGVAAPDGSAAPSAAWQSMVDAIRVHGRR